LRASAQTLRLWTPGGGYQRAALARFVSTVHGWAKALPALRELMPLPQVLADDEVWWITLARRLEGGVVDRCAVRVAGRRRGRPVTVGLVWTPSGAIEACRLTAAGRVASAERGKLCRHGSPELATLPKATRELATRLLEGEASSLAIEDEGIVLLRRWPLGSVKEALDTLGALGELVERLGTAGGPYR